MANRFLNNVKINDAYVLPPTVGTSGQYMKLTDAAAGTTAWADLGQAAEVSTISYEVRNETGSPIPIGSVVYVNGGSGSSDHVTIALSTASTEAGSSKTFAITAETINHNSTGRVVLEGIIEGVDTGSFTPGQTLWLSTTAGQITGTPPTTPDHAVFVGYAVRCQQNNGSIFVKIQNGVELGEVHDVLLTSTADKDVIRYDSALGYWVNSTVASILPDSGVIAGQYGDASNIPQITIGADGRITNATDVAVNIPAGTTIGTAGNEVSGTVTLAGGGDTTVTQAGNLITISSTSSGGGGGATLSIERDVFTATANQTAFTITSPITSSSNTQVYIDGVYQAKSNYTASGSTITFSTGVPLGAEVEVVHFISVYSKIYTDSFTGDGTTVNYTASKDVTDENVTQVYIDGVYQSKDNYTTSGTTITFSTSPPSGSAIEVVHFTAVDYSSIASNQFTGTGLQTDFTLTQGVSVDNSFVFIQGVYQEKSTYSITGTTLSFTTAPLSGYTIEVITVGAVSVFSDTLYVDTFTGVQGQVDYTLSSSPASVNAIDVYLNGIYQNKSNFSVSGNTLTFSSAPTAGTAIEVKSTGGLNNVVSSGAGGGIQWDATPKTANFTAIAGKGYVVNTTSAAITVTLPSSPSAGDELTIVDYAGTANTNNIAITSSDNINGSSADVFIDYERGGVSMVYVDATQGWIAYNAANETATSLSTGATIDYLVVAAGGGGGGGISNDSPGGGGAGAVIYESETSSITTGVFYDINIGSGGSGGGDNARGSNGTDSYIQQSSADIIRAKGGGGGGSQAGPGLDGGSGGGGTRDGDSNISQTGGSAVTTNVAPSGATIYGNDGANGNGTDTGGGGGAGETGNVDGSGFGGDGIQINIDGNNYYWGGGGGAGSGDGGQGGGGGGARTGAGGLDGINNGDNAPGTDAGGSGGDNTGGGGGGATNPTGAPGGNGGSGIIILKYTKGLILTVGSGLTYSTDTSTFTKYNVTTFTAGTGTISFS